MSSISHPSAASADAHPAPSVSDAARARRRRRALVVTAVVTLGSFGLLLDLLLVGHTSGEQIWGPVTAAMTALVGALSLMFLGTHGRRHAARLALYALWLTVAFFGFGGYQSHRMVDEASGPPPLAPLVFTGLGIAGAVSLRYGTKED